MKHTYDSSIVFFVIHNVRKISHFLVSIIIRVSGYAYALIEYGYNNYDTNFNIMAAYGGIGRKIVSKPAR